MIYKKSITRWQKSPNYPWIVWVLTAGFFFAEYLVRLEPSINKQQLMQAFSLNATGFGTLSAFFTLSYVVMQIPVGTLIDKFGAHKLMVINTVGCAIGCFIFASANTLWLAEFARLISGVGAAFAFVGTLILAANWFPASKIGLISGMTQAAGMLGAAVGEGPFAAITAQLGWRPTMNITGLVILLLAIAIWLVVTEKPANTKTIKVKSPSMISCLKAVLRNPQSWYNGIFVGLLYAPTAAFAELWGVSFLAETYNMSNTIAATGISTIFLGWAIGGPIAGWISDKQKKRKPTMIISAALSLITISIVLYIPNIPLGILFSLLFLFGLVNTGVACSYAVASEINNESVRATSIAFANMASVIIGSILQPVMGVILDHFWTGEMLNGSPAYSIAAYQNALLALPICLVCAIMVSFKIRETNCTPQII